jgi:hypothetical protein
MASLLERLRGKGWKVEFKEGDEGDPLGFVVRIHDDAGNQVDLIGGIRRLDPGFFDRVVEADLQGLNLLFASPEDLVALKIFAGGPKDLEDAAGVVEVAGEALDRALLIRLCRRFGPEEEKRCEKLLNTR